MVWYLSEKLLGLVVTVLVAALLIFIVLDLLPGDPARFILGLNATPETLAALQQQYGLDQSPFQRFFSWLGNMLKGDFGISTTAGQPVAGMVGAALGVTLPLSLLAIIFALGIGVPLGIAAARREGTLLDRALMGLARIGIALPAFWLGMLLVQIFAVALHWLPPGGFVSWSVNPLTAFASLLLPALALALPVAALLARNVRVALVAATGADYIRTAQAGGLTQREAVWRHGLRNALLASLGTAGLYLAYLVAGTVIVESVFYLPGLGRLILDAIAGRDLLLLRSTLLILVLCMLGTTFLANLVPIWTDPRLRQGSLE
ncbi:MAG: ABC transporter permease [Hyphomicrobiales bacterium]|nr:MAG: ABC transporter permease [Hyphomicrobiales bacterium]